MQEKDRPLTKGDLQTILDAIRNGNRDTDNKLDEMQEDLNQVKQDVDTIAKNTAHTRDRKGQLRKTA